jgi:hypothetical protein
MFVVENFKDWEKDTKKRYIFVHFLTAANYDVPYDFQSFFLSSFPLPQLSVSSASF